MRIAAVRIMLRSPLRSLSKIGIIHVVVNINCNYRHAAVAGDVLRIETELCR